MITDLPIIFYDLCRFLYRGKFYIIFVLSIAIAFENLIQTIIKLKDKSIYLL